MDPALLSISFGLSLCSLLVSALAIWIVVGCGHKTSTLLKRADIDGGPRNLYYCHECSCIFGR